MWTFLKRISLTQWIIIAMLLGVFLGWAFPDPPAGVAPHGFQATSLRPLSTIFLNMIKSLIVPLIFSTLVVGIAGHGDDMKRVGRLALRSIVYFEIVTTLALAVGLLAVNVLRPGAGVDLSGASASQGAELATKHITFGGVLEHVVPSSFFAAATSNEVLQVVFWAILFAVALARVTGRNKSVMLEWLESLADVMFKFTALVM
jgi:proton glutamate symport protein